MIVSGAVHFVSLSIGNQIVMSDKDPPKILISQMSKTTVGDKFKMSPIEKFNLNYQDT